MDVTEALETVRDRLGRQQVFGEPVTQDGTIVLPVMRFGGGAGGGEDEPGADDGGHRRAPGSGVGFGFGAAPAGVYTIRDGKVSWQPAVNANRVILGGQILGGLALLVLYVLVRSRAAVRAAAVVPVGTPGEPGPDGAP